MSVAAFLPSNHGRRDETILQSIQGGINAWVSFPENLLKLTVGKDESDAILDYLARPAFTA